MKYLYPARYPIPVFLHVLEYVHYNVKTMKPYLQKDTLRFAAFLKTDLPNT